MPLGEKQERKNQRFFPYIAPIFITIDMCITCR